MLLLLIAARTGLPPLSTTICCRRSAVFGHLARLGDEVPAHKTLYSCVRLSQGRLPDPTWKRRPGRPRGRWIDQLRRERDNNRPPADQWKLAKARSQWKSDATVSRLRDYLTWPDYCLLVAIYAIIIIIIWLVKRQYVLKRLQWRWRTELVAEAKCLTENVCLQPGFKHSQWTATCNING